MKYLQLSVLLTTSVLVTSCGHTNGTQRGADLSAAADIIEVLIDVSTEAQAEALLQAKIAGDSQQEERVLEFYDAVFYALRIANYELEIAARYQNEGNAALAKEYKRCAIALVYTVIDALKGTKAKIPAALFHLIPSRPEGQPTCVI